MKSLGLLVGVVSGVVFAQGGTAKVAPFPLEVRQLPPNVNPATLTAELRAEFVKLLKEKGVFTPSSFEVSSALEAGGRRDCESDDACLSALAIRTSSLYAVFALLEWNLVDTVTVSGRVVRDDGFNAVGKKSASVKVSKAEPFTKAAKSALRKFVDELDVASLPTAKPVSVVERPAAPVDAGVPVVVTAPPVDAGVELTPPPPPIVDRGPPAGRIAGYAIAGTGSIVAATGLALFLGGRTEAGAQLDEQGRLKADGDRQKLRNAVSQQGVGVGLLSGGLVAAAVGVVLVLASGDEPGRVTFFAAPTPGGAAVGLQGEWP